MTITYESIYTTTSNNDSQISFTSIPATYTDLVLVITGANSGSGTKYIRFNNSSTNYQVTSFMGGGVSYLYVGQYNNASWIDAYNAGTNPYITVVHIPEYANSSIKKRYLSRHATGRVSAEMFCGGWDGTAAIDRVDIYISGNNFGSSTFSLYGIKSE